MIKRHILVALSWACITSARSAPPAVSHRFVPLLVNEVYSTAFWDAADLRRSGDDVETGMLRIPLMFGVSKSGALSVSNLPDAYLIRMTISCRWRTYRLLSVERSNSAGETMPSPTGDEGVFSQFARPSSSEEEVIGRVCDPEGVSLAQSFATIEDARPYVQAMLGMKAGAPPPPPLILPPPAPPAPPSGLPGMPPRRFPPVAKEPLGMSLVATDPVSGNMAFFDWAHLARTGDHATAPTLHIVGPGQTGMAPAAGLRSVALTVETYDCKATTVQENRKVIWDLYAQFLAQSLKDGLARPAAPGTVDAIELAQACSGHRSGQKYSNLNDAVDFAWTRWAMHSRP